MERSRKLVLTDWTKANDALNVYFEGNKSKLAKHVQMSRSTVTAFFKLEPVREAEFRKICLALRLNWQEVSTVQAIPGASFADAPQSETEIDPLQQVREHCRQKILSQHSRMRLLSGEEIGVDQLYVDVWLLNRSPRTYQVSQDKLLQTFDLRNDRLGLGDRIQRNPGFEIANANPKLVILGKPGAGKTTFLKHLAVDWCKGQFRSDWIAVFIELRRIRDGQWRLMDAIHQELGLQDPKQIKALLQQGKLLVLMDGLDEVPTNQLQRNVQHQLREMVEQYANNRWILTCRTQIIASIPDGFTSVEVADFSSEQVQQFVQNWFQASGQSDAEGLQQWERFNHAVGKNSALKELTVTPVLLSLMCLVFHDEGDMPSQMTDLYKRGIRLLLEKWNDAKAIAGWEVGSDTYRQLTVEQKQTLLIKIAARKFENPKNFVLFEQDEIAAQIADFLHLAQCQEGVAVLKAMEAQHGLLIERADELWSFSHLTFQEHFTLQWLTQLPPEQLAEKIANPQWQKVVEQLVKSQQPADRLLRLIKQSIDRLISDDPTLNQFLTWVFEKAGSIQANYKPAALRAFYSTRYHTHAHASNLPIALALDFALEFNHTHDHDAHAPARVLDHIAHNYALALDLDYAIARALNHAFANDHAIAIARDLTFVIARAHDYNYAIDHAIANAIDLAIDHVLNIALDYVRNLDFELVIKLEQFRTEVHWQKKCQNFQQWWRAESQQWLEKLRQAMIAHRNIGHSWQFTEIQRCQLQRYYDTNHFLVNLIQIEGAVSQEVRAEIEDSLLLPWEELQRRFPEVYGSDSSLTTTQPNMKSDQSDQEVFISYAWGGDSEAIVNQLDQAFQNKGITLIRDKRDLDFKGRIKAFMQRIGRGKCVVIVISEKYLKSENCMYELVQIAKNGEFYDRIFPIVLADANIYKPIHRLQYIQHWEAQIEQLNEALKTVNAANLQGFRDDIDLYTEIRAAIAGLIDILKDMNTLTPEMHTESGFDQLFQAVERKLAE